MLEQKANIGELCNGSTTDSDSVCEGSNPSSPAKTKDHPHGGPLFWLINGRTRKAGPEKALNGLFPAVAFPQKSESNGWQEQKKRRFLRFFQL